MPPAHPPAPSPLPPHFAEFQNEWLLSVYRAALGPLLGPLQAGPPPGLGSPHPRSSRPPSPSLAAPLHELLCSYPPPSSACSSLTGTVTALRLRCSNQQDTNDSLVTTVARLSGEHQSLRFSEAALREQLAGARGGLAEAAREGEEQLRRFEERERELRRLAEDAREQGEGARAAERDMVASLLAAREAHLGRIAGLEGKLAEVESFLPSGAGRDCARMEEALAETKLRLALAEAERDELEVAMLDREGGGGFDDASSYQGSEYWDYKVARRREAGGDDKENGGGGGGAGGKGGEDHREVARKVFGLRN